MKQGFSIWLPPVFISLVLHLVAVLIFINQTQRQTAFRPDSLVVEMQTISVKPAAPPISKPQFKPVPKIEPVKQSESEAVLTPQAETVTPQPVETPAPAEAAKTANTTSLPEIQPLAKLSRPPAFLRKIDPVYPPGEQRSGSQAYVLAEITLDAEGKLLEVKILKSAGKQFDDAVLEAIRNSEFQPGYIESRPVAVRVQIPFRFKLK